jgi:hypothetical protein
LSAPFYSSKDVLDFWERTPNNLRTGRVWEIPLLELMKRSWLELRLTVHFISDWMRYARREHVLIPALGKSQ